MAKKKGRIWIGTSNVVVPGNKTTFPPAFQDKSRLNYYSSLFNSVEVNSSFYKTPLPTTYKKWNEDVARDFHFSIKLTRDITHQKGLSADTDPISKFIDAAAGLGEKKGCLLVQFPGKITLEYFKQVETILEAIADADTEKEWKVAVEFRNAGWYVGEGYELLREYNAALVLHDIPKSRIFEPVQLSDFVYLRFHGPKGDYRDSYSDAFLADKAKQVKQWASQGKDVYIYFNNTMGSAFENARTLQSLVTPKKKKR